MARNALTIVVGFWVVALAGFWPTYFSRLSDVPLHGHVHGLIVFGWYSLLLLQVLLIHTRRRKYHRAIGKLAFIYAPLLIVVTLFAGRGFLQAAKQFPAGYAESIFAAIIALLMSFTILFVQAMRNRPSPPVHARYMISTGIVFLMPALSRFIGIYLQPLFMEVNEQSPASVLLVPDYLGLLTLQLFTLALFLRDWRKGRPASPYGICLIVLVLSLAVLHWLPGEPWWLAFSEAFAQL